jgi:hypothetical protein
MPTPDPKPIQHDAQSAIRGVTQAKFEALRQMVTGAAVQLERPEIYLPLLFLFAYIAVHAYQILMTGAAVHSLEVFFRKLSDPETYAEHGKELASAVTLGMSASLLTLSLAMALRHKSRDLAIAAPNAIFWLFSIYLVGQIFVLIAGHAAIISSAASTNAYFSVVVTFTLFGALITVFLMEYYIIKTYRAARDVFPEKSIIESNHSKWLLLLAIGSFVLGMVKNLFASFDALRLGAISTVLLLDSFIFLASITLIARSIADENRSGNL